MKNKYYCIDCDKEIHYNTAKYGSGMCGSCANSGNNNPMFGKKRNLKGKNNPSFGKKRLDVIIRNKKMSGKNHPNYGKKNPEHSKRMLGRNNPNWIEDKIRFYPIGWTKVFKETIRERDSHQCQICGSPEVECLKKLDVHHIDYDKNNLDFYNLISLCKKCHSRTNGNREYWKRYLENKILKKEGIL